VMGHEVGDGNGNGVSSDIPEATLASKQ